MNKKKVVFGQIEIKFMGQRAVTSTKVSLFFIKQQITQ